ncbi:MAG: hypothetical protein ACFE9L_12505 [Candidatus Hodarchaeota archaeon]
MRRPISISIVCILVISMSMSLIAPSRAGSTQIEAPLEETPIHFDTFEELNNQEAYTQTVYTDLEEINGTKELAISPLQSLQSVQSDIRYDTVDYWLLNFTYEKVYQSHAHQEKTKGALRYNLNQTITTTLFASMPVVLATYRNDSVNTNEQTQIITQALVDEKYQANMGFSFNFAFDYFFKAKLLFLEPKVGPGTGNLHFGKKWTFNTPMNGKGVLGKLTVPFPLAIPLLNLGVSVEPTIDTDFSAKVRSNESGIGLSSTNLEWEKDGSIQSFSMAIPESFSQNITTVDLFDFDMEFVLSLIFYLKIKVGLPVFNLPFKIKIFSFPIAKTHLYPENLNVINLETTVNLPDRLPFVYGVHYNYSDVNGDNDGILEPEDVVDFSVWVTNLGDGSALAVNSTVDSLNVTISGQDSTPLLERNRGAYDLHSGFQFTIPVAYAGSFILANITFEYLATNGSKYTNIYELYFRVVLPGDTYLEVSDLYLDHPGDYWKTGDDVGIFFNVTNRGSADIQNAQILVAEAYDTDTLNTATLVSDQTNISSVSIGSSETLGFVNISTTTAHDDGLIYLYFYVYYEDATYAYADLLNFAIPVFLPKPEFDILSAVGYETDADGLFEAGETVEIEFTVQNIGESNAFDVSGVITTDNPDLNITRSNVTLGNLAASASTTSTRAIIEIPLTAKNQTATFTLHLIAKDVKGHEILHMFNITIEITELPPPKLTLLSYTIDDSVFGNNDGIPDPGEIFLLYINIQVDNIGFSVSGSANTSSELFFYNASSFYGDLTDQTSSGDGFVVEVPLNYPGGISRIDVTVFAESYSGRKVNATGYLELTIDTGDTSAPLMTLLDTIPDQVIQNTDLSFSIKVQDLSVGNEITSGIDRVLLVWTFNDGDIQITEISDPDADGSYDIKLNTFTLGIYYFIPVAIDMAGNIQFIAENDEVFIVEVISEITTSEPSTTPTTTVDKAPLPIFFALIALVSTIIIWRSKQNYLRKRR